ncbi:hypothetical protein NYR75_08535 [Actinobacillus equuli subsp. haemolyticus]|uniref:hypothetical protein n=1 Tax=Actinobacillus equuli TaxID=718 RepID=UPI002440F9F5|nr:hypothetical protein [Actinobacillus equuli]WGE62802.1 hypothetical protein NYR75_08535 [Actinobacillus equuli subsp. haemolyticus]
MSFIDYKKRRIIQRYLSYITIARITFCSFLFGAFTTFIYLNEIGARNLFSLSTSKEIFLSLTGAAIFFTTLFMIYGISSISFKKLNKKENNNVINEEAQIKTIILFNLITSIAFYFYPEYFWHMLIGLSVVTIITIKRLLTKNKKYTLIDYIDIYLGYGFYIWTTTTVSLFISYAAYIFFNESLLAYGISILILTLLHTSYSFYVMGKIKSIKIIINLHIITFFIIMLCIAANGKTLMNALGIHDNNEKPYVILNHEEYILNHPKNIINGIANKLNKRKRIYCGSILYEDNKYKIFLPHHETDVKNNIIIPDQNIKLYQGLFKDLICEQSITLWNVGYLIK